MVLRLTLPSGAQFVIDTTHYQWGWAECVYDWDAFVELRTSAVIGIAPFGHWGGTTCPARDVQPAPGSYEFNIILLRKEVMNAVVKKMRALLKRFKVWSGFIDLSDVTWHDDTDKISLELEQAMKDTQKANFLGGLGRIYFEESENFFRKQGEEELWKKATWKHNVTTKKIVAIRYQKVWLS